MPNHSWAIRVSAAMRWVKTGWAAKVASTVAPARAAAEALQPGGPVDRVRASAQDRGVEVVDERGVGERAVAQAELGGGHQGVGEADRARSTAQTGCPHGHARGVRRPPERGPVQAIGHARALLPGRAAREAADDVRRRGTAEQRRPVPDQRGRRRSVREVLELAGHERSRPGERAVGGGGAHPVGERRDACVDAGLAVRGAGLATEAHDAGLHPRPRSRPARPVVRRSRRSTSRCPA